MIGETDRNVAKFVGKFARSYISYPHLLQSVLGLGDMMFNAYEELNDEEKVRACRWCMSVIANELTKEAQRDE